MRPEGWESLLAAHIASARTTTFAWGTHDCVLWCADWVNTLTGSDPAQGWRDTYATEDEAREVLASLGCSAWSDLADLFLPATPVARARRGDIVLHPVSGCLGIVDGPHAYFLTERGVTRVEFTRCGKAWAVG